MLQSNIKECLTTVKQVFFSYTNGGILSGYLSLLALHLSGTPSLTPPVLAPLAVYSSTNIYAYPWTGLVIISFTRRKVRKYWQ